MYIYIFDLDDTLLHVTYQKYSDIKPDLELNKLLNNINSPKYIFTNAIKTHSDKSLHKLKISQHFLKTYSRDTIPDMKPNINSYKYVERDIMIDFVSLDYILEFENTIIFFDDRLENLKSAKLCGWNTVFIGNENMRFNYKFIDLSFNNIYDALNYFI